MDADNPAKSSPRQAQALQLRLLGPAQVRGPDGTALSLQPKRLALLTYLAVAKPRGAHRRDTLLGLFWPDQDAESARGALRQALRGLRQALPSGALVTRGDDVGLDRVWMACDVWAFEDAVERGELERAVSSYRAPFLQGFFLSDCSEFERWADGERDRLARSYRTTLEQLAERAANAGDRLAAVSWWRRVSEHEPFSTRVAVRVMEALEAAGDRAGALQYAEQHAARLREELGAEPAPDVAALADRLRAHPVGHPSLQTFVGRRTVAPDTGERFRTAMTGRYNVQRELGHGGMATVYLAEDLKHDRQVAVKLLKPELTAAVGKDRFLREIRVTARLNHPHILPLLDSGEAEGFLYYVMPHVEGESLRARLARERELPVGEAVQIACQVADALAHAHDLGVVHRDIKPENILLSGGHALVTDFGIARATGALSGETLTETGLSLGTPAYMSPEQATAGRDVDGRTDLYSLGVVLYEMLTGEPPFTGKTSQAVMVRLLTERPTSVRTFRDAVPEALERVVMQSLAKVPADRFATMREFAEQLEDAGRAVVIPDRPAAVPPPAVLERPELRPARPRVSRRIGLAVGGTLALGLATALTLAVVPKPGGGPTTPAPVFRQFTFTGDVTEAALSPDGKLVAYATSPRLGPFISKTERILVKQVAGDEARTVADSLSNICGLRFTPAGDRLTFSTEGGRGLESGAYAVSWLGGRPTPIFENAAGCHLLSPDGSTMVWFWPNRAGKIQMIRETLGSGKRDTTTLDVHEYPYGAHWSRDGRWIAAATADMGRSSHALVTISPNDGSTNSIVTDEPYARSPRWSADGGAIYYAAGLPSAAELKKLRVNARTGRAEGRPELLLTGIPLKEFDISNAGNTIALTRSRERGHIWVGSIPERSTRDLVALRRLSEANVAERDPAVAPDGRTVAFVRGELSNNDIFVRATTGGSAERVTSLNAPVSRVQWSPDGQRVAFVWDSAGTPGLTVASVSSRRSVRLYSGGIREVWSWAPDLDWAPAGIVFVSDDSDTSSVLNLLDPETGTVRAIPPPPGYHCLFGPLTSPDGSRVHVSARSSCTFDASRSKIAGLLLSLPGGELIGSLEFDGSAAGWATNDRIYYHTSAGGRTEIWSIPSEGGTPNFHLRLDVRCYRVSVSRDATTFACDEPYTDSDIWIVEGFGSRVR